MRESISGMSLRAITNQRNYYFTFPSWVSTPSIFPGNTIPSKKAERYDKSPERMGKLSKNNRILSRDRWR